MSQLTDGDEALRAGGCCGGHGRRLPGGGAINAGVAAWIVWIVWIAWIVWQAGAAPRLAGMLRCVGGT
ncbi:hypothetical protein VC218_10760 [Xanthomonas nasturtii]|nr:hypothetical protein [Xanthomonas nasturtii]